MSTYVIGDIQGCYDELETLLDLIQFNTEKDQVWFTGDLVCRGPKSLESLRLVRNLNLTQNAFTVLGNHDLHLLAVHYAPHLSKSAAKKQAFLDILESDDRDSLLEWLIAQPLLYLDERLGYVMTHAGIFPEWTLEEAKAYAKEVEKAIQEKEDFFFHIYGDLPDQWDPQLTGWDRLRFITNVFTRMRFFSKEGKMDFQCTGPADFQPGELIPWFKIPNRIDPRIKILFGHWAALRGETGHSGIFSLDGGCVWGGHLIAMRLEDRQVFKVSCENKKL